ncbi:uncharacterized protein TNCV_1034561 [Trichonephila clavipes]|nr:uncharacterized protein TNCV_1034561 [Trichonephila clavipes]
MSPSEQEEDERGPMPTSAIKDLFKKWNAVRAMVLEWHPKQADVSRVGDIYNDNAITYFRKIPKKREICSGQVVSLTRKPQFLVPQQASHLFVNPLKGRKAESTLLRLGLETRICGAEATYATHQPPGLVFSKA